MRNAEYLSCRTLANVHAASSPPHVDPPSPLPHHGRWASYVFMQPKWVHVPYLRTIHMFVAKSLNQALNTLKPDLVVRGRETCGYGRVHGGAGGA